MNVSKKVAKSFDRYGIVKENTLANILLSNALPVAVFTPTWI